ncbi:MAG TPA: EthD family reductase [Nocardioides sp.]
MFRVTASYHHPADADAFLAHYRAVHDPLTRTMPGLAAFEWGVCETPDGSRPPYFVVAVLTFPDRETALTSLGSTEGQAGAADMANFAMAGVEVTMWEAQG